MPSGPRIVSAAPAGPQEDALERALRPKRLDEYIGQQKIRDQLDIFVAAARGRSEPLDHVLLFGPLGLTIWAVQMAWIPIWAAGVVNGLGHYIGYRNYDCNDAATNLVPWGIIIGG
ncbi:hypothetical protein NL493_27860, partial [Klebsiella pneumoniae]|nr:hypothetical protein [Klebsiella pneumoniae]